MTTVFVTGVFDLMHYGHMKFMARAKQHGDRLLVGVHPDNEVKAAKGRPPIMTQEERIEAIKMLNYVDDIVPDVPYNLTVPYLRELQRTQRIDKVACSEEYNVPEDLSYKGAKDAGFEMVYIPRTEGISTTELRERVLRLD